MRRLCALVVLACAVVAGPAAAAPLGVPLPGVPLPGLPPAAGTPPRLPLGTGPPQVDLTCELALVRLEPNVSNTLLLDTGAVYWLVSYHAVPGTRLRITGEFPHARYISWNLYDAAARPIDALSDVQITPDPGSANPFLPGARRTVRRRSYTAYVQFTARPAHPAPNTMYASTGAGGTPNLSGTLWYRVYVPDRGRDIEGGVPLPQVEVQVEPVSGEASPTGATCSRFQAPAPPQLQEMFRNSNGVPLSDQTAAVGYPGRNPPSWHLFANFSLAFTEILTDNAYTSALNAAAHNLPTSNPSNPGIFANRDNAYVYAATSQGFGPILMIHARAPTFANTAGGAPVMPSGEQVRYFSMCEYEPAEMRVIACARDDQTALRDGDYTYVISTPANRPANATARCGVTWIPWGPAPYGLLILRNLLASPSFADAIQNVGTPGRERQVMGPYYPAGRYFASPAAFETLGCPATPPSGGRHVPRHRSRA